MGEYTAVTIIVGLKSLAVIAAICAAAYLAYNRLDGWGWFLFLALCITPGSIKLGT